MKEKREYVRLDLNLRVDWKKIMETSDIIAEFPDVTSNISTGGLCLIMDDRIKIGDKLQVRIELPSKKIINAQGRVTWISEYEITGRANKKMYYTGIEFTEIYDVYLEELNKFVLTSMSSK
jgi:c-di-GMP-binding flagellar brake protein YcgR